MTGTYNLGQWYEVGPGTYPNCILGIAVTAKLDNVTFDRIGDDFGEFTFYWVGKDGELFETVKWVHYLGRGREV
jgi:hypothetical protein